MRPLEPAASFNRKAHEDEHDDDEGGTGLLTSFRPGYWYTPFISSGADLVGFTPTLNRVVAMPVWIGQAVSIQAVGLNVTVGGAAGSVMRLGIYDGDSPGYFPKTLLLDAGTVATTGVGFGAITVDVALPGGHWCWLTAVAQVASPTLSSAQGTNIVLSWPFGMSDSGGFPNFNTYEETGIHQTTGVSGALPAEWPDDDYQHDTGDATAIVQFRVA